LGGDFIAALARLDLHVHLLATAATVAARVLGWIMAAALLDYPSPSSTIGLRIRRNAAGTGSRPRRPGLIGWLLPRSASASTFISSIIILLPTDLLCSDYSADLVLYHRSDASSGAEINSEIEAASAEMRLTAHAPPVPLPETGMTGL